MRRTTLIALTAGLVAVVAVGLAAQKSKPAPAPTYTWSATLPTEGDADMDIYGPGAPFNAASGEVVQVSVNPPNRKSGFVGASYFYLSIPPTSESWVGFRNFAYGIPPTPIGPCVYPLFDAAGWMIPGTSTAPTEHCVVDFLSGPGPIGHRHPSGTYGMAVIQLAALGVDFESISEGAETPEGSGYLALAVYREQSCYSDADPYSGVAFTAKWQDGSIKIRRVDPDTWTIDFTLPTSVYEFVPVAPVTTKRGTTTTTCYSSLVAKTTTAPINGQMTVIRTRVP